MELRHLLSGIVMSAFALGLAASAVRTLVRQRKTLEELRLFVFARVWGVTGSALLAAGFFVFDKPVSPVLLAFAVLAFILFFSTEQRRKRRISDSLEPE